MNTAVTVRFCLALALGLTVTAPTMAADVTINARARTVCRVEGAALSAPLAEGVNSLGAITELCNNMQGYRVVLNHPAGLQDAFVLIGNDRIPLKADGTATVIVDSGEPAFVQRNLALELASDVGDLPLALRVEAKGAIY